MTKNFLLFFTFLSCYCTVMSQPFRFVHITDTHVGGSTGAEDLERAVTDVNRTDSVDFVLVTGDITEFGSGAELLEAKSILDRLNKPYYVVPGNHDSKWSESGGNDFGNIFGSEVFSFDHRGILFIGTPSGPYMRMAGGQVPHEYMLYIDSVLMRLKNPGQPVVFINHYPLDASLSNSRDILERLKQVNTRVVLLGHGHTNKLYDFEGIPGIMGRSNLRASQPSGGYNIGTVRGDTLYYAEKIPGKPAPGYWCKIPLWHQKNPIQVSGISRPDSSVSLSDPRIHKVWEIQETSDIGSGVASRGRICVISGTAGQITAMDNRHGTLIWRYQTGGKVYATPAISGKKVVCPSTDGFVYCLNIKNGRLLWSYRTGNPIVASPVIRNNKVYLGSSSGTFSAFNMRNGHLVWHYDSIRNFVETRPLIYRRKLYFGSWGNTFYALDQRNGNLAWKREKYNNRMLSPAAVWPVAAKNKVFIAAPDRHMTALNAKTGKEIWDSGKWSCRESIGLSVDKKLVYIKNMTEGNVDAFYTKTDTQQLAWETKVGLGYEIAPSPITAKGDLVFIPTTGGMIYCINRKTHAVTWKYQLSNTLINHILPIGRQRILVTSMDGKVACLGY